MGIALDVIGTGMGSASEEPERILGDYDLGIRQGSLRTGGDGHRLRRDFM